MFSQSHVNLTCHVIHKVKKKQPDTNYLLYINTFNIELISMIKCVL